jgi:hypothetical protein
MMLRRGSPPPQKHLEKNDFSPYLFIAFNLLPPKKESSPYTLQQQLCEQTT